MLAAKNTSKKTTSSKFGDLTAKHSTTTEDFASTTELLMTHLCEICQNQIKQKSQPYVKEHKPITLETIYIHLKCYEIYKYGSSLLP